MNYRKCVSNFLSTQLANRQIMTSIKRPIMRHTQILVHSLGPRTRILALFFAHVTYWAMLATIYFGKFLLPPGNLRSQQTQWITGSVFQISYQPNWQIDKLWPLLKGQSCGTLKSWYTAWDLEQGFWRCFLHMLLTGLCLQQSTLVNFYYHLGICKILQSVKTVIRNEECVSCLSVILTRSIALVMPVFHKEKTATAEPQCNSPRDWQNKLCSL